MTPEELRIAKLVVCTWMDCTWGELVMAMELHQADLPYPPGQLDSLEGLLGQGLAVAKALGVV